MRAGKTQEAREVKKNFTGGPTDPEYARAVAGVGFLTVEGLSFYPIADPIKDYADAEETGRCLIRCMDVGGTTIACATIYGWTGGKVGNKEASRTDDLLAIVRMQFAKLAPGPKIIGGDLNGCLDALPTIIDMIKEEGWTDVGNDAAKCRGCHGQPTCHANAEAKESRIDFVITNDRMTPAVTLCFVDNDADYPTHRPVVFDVATNKLETTTKELIKPTDFAVLFEEKVQDEVQKERQAEIEKNKLHNEDPEGVDENKIRRAHLNKLHGHMDEQLEKRRYRLQTAVHNKNTTQLWDLIAASTEEANIDQSSKGVKPPRCEGGQK
jgi:hypothetical protein